MDWLSVKQASALLGGVSPQLCYKLYHRGELEGAKIAGTVRIRTASVAAYLVAHSNRKAPPCVTVERESPRAVQPRRKAHRAPVGFIHIRPQS